MQYMGINELNNLIHSVNFFTLNLNRLDKTTVEQYH